MNSDYAEIRSLYIIDAAADAVGDSTPHPRDLFARGGSLFEDQPVWKKLFLVSLLITYAILLYRIDIG